MAAPYSVIPVQTGIQCHQEYLDARLRGYDKFLIEFRSCGFSEAQDNRLIPPLIRGGREGLLTKITTPLLR